MYLDMSIKIGFVAGTITAHGANEGFLSGMNLNMPIQQSFTEKMFPAIRPGANIPVLVTFFIMNPHIRLTEECDSTAKVGRTQSLMHG